MSPYRSIAYPFFPVLLATVWRSSTHTKSEDPGGVALGEVHFRECRTSSQNQQTFHDIKPTKKKDWNTINMITLLDPKLH